MLYYTYLGQSGFEDGGLVVPEDIETGRVVVVVQVAMVDGEWGVVLLAGDVLAFVQLARRNFNWGFSVAVLKKNGQQTCG